MNPFALLLAASLTIPSPVLVLRSGDRIEVEPGIRVDERTVVFRTAGNLYSMPVTEIDIDATRAAANTIIARPDNDRGKLKVSAAEKERLLRELEQNHNGTAAPKNAFDVKQPSPAEQQASVADEWSWRRAARQHEENIRQAKEELELLQSRAAQLERQIESYVSLGYKPQQFTYQSSQLQITLDSMPRAELEVTRARRAFDQFKEDARKQGIMPGWLR